MSWVLRSESALNVGPPPYSDADAFTLKIISGGSFKNQTTEYVGSKVKVNYVDYVEWDRFSLIELKSMATEIGFRDLVSFCFIENDTTLKHIFNDTDCFSLRRTINSDAEVIVYIMCSQVDEGIGDGVGEGVNEGMDKGLNEGLHELSDNDNESNDSESHSDSDSVRSYEPMYDSAYEQDGNDDDLFDKNVDKGLEFCGDYLINKAKEKIVDGCEQEEEVSLYDSDELGSLLGSDDEGNVHKFPTFNPRTEMANPVLKVGMLFSDHNELKEAIRNYGIKHGKGIRFQRSEAKRVKAVCVKGCPWMVYASRQHNSTSMQIKTLLNEHKCSRGFHNNAINSKWLSLKYLDTIKNNPKIPSKAFIASVKKDYVVNVSRSQFYRTKRKAMQFIDGSIVEQYAKLWMYIEEIRRTNPDTTIFMSIEEGTIDRKEPRFKRFYCCLGALKRGFKAGCRKVIGVDGCHLMGKYKGILLSAIAVDSNNCMYPVAYAVVEGETKDSWKWFLETLQQDLGIWEQEKWCFLSDKQKGLLPAFDEVLPRVEHRFCVMHLHANMQTAGFRGNAYKNRLWAAARATNKPMWKEEMEKMKQLDESAYKWLEDKNPIHWTRSHFTDVTKCDILLNNICENFNKCILEPRGRPILGLLEGVRNYLMVRLQECRQRCERWNGKLCPKIHEIIEKNKVESGNCIPIWSGDYEYQVSSMNTDQFTVNLKKKECSCGAWSLTGIPCCHAISCISHKHEEAEDYVPKCYLIATYKKIYAPFIKGINGSKMWPESPLEPVIPPFVDDSKNKKKKRKKQAWEYAEEREKSNRKRRSNRINASHSSVNEDPKPEKLGKRHQKDLKCGYCREIGHNRRSCKKLKETMSGEDVHEDINNETVAEEAERGIEHSEGYNLEASDDQFMDQHGGYEAGNAQEEDQPYVPQFDPNYQSPRSVPMLHNSFEEAWVQIMSTFSPYEISPVKNSNINRDDQQQGQVEIEIPLTAPTVGNSQTTTADNVEVNPTSITGDLQPTITKNGQNFVTMKTLNDARRKSKRIADSLQNDIL